MVETQHYDVIIIGSGAGGGTLAHRLAPSGKRVLILERGDYLPRERDNWDSTAVFVQGKYRAQEFWYDKDGNEFPPEVNYYVGGNTKFYGAALFRLRPEDFSDLRHYGGVSPAWPIGYDDLEPYYTEAEHLYLVHGAHGEDPSEGHASAPYAHPPVRHEPRIQQLSDDLEKQGLHPFHLPIGVNLTQDEHGAPTHASACIRCDRVDGFPCLVQAQVRRPGHRRRPGAAPRQRRDGDRTPGWTGSRPTPPGAPSPGSSPTWAASASRSAPTSWSSPPAR